MSDNNNIDSNFQRSNCSSQQKRHHKYIFSKYNILNHENTLENVETKKSSHYNDKNHKDLLTNNNNNNSILIKIRNKLKEKKKQETSSYIEDNKKINNNNINSNINNNKKFSKSLERNKQRIAKKKKENKTFINHKYSDLISPLHINKYIDNIHKRINSSGIYNNDNNYVEKKSRYNHSFREIIKKIKHINNRSFENSLDNSKDNTENNNKKINLTSMDLEDNNNSISNDISNEVNILSTSKDNDEDDIMNNEEIINMSKKKNKILEEIKLKKKELRLTELSLELLKKKYKKSSNEQQIKQITDNHKTMNKYNLTVSIPRNKNSSKNSTLNRESNTLAKKSFFAKTSLNKNRKRISPSYNKDILDLKHSLKTNKNNHSFQLRNYNLNHINFSKSKNSNVRNKSKKNGNSSYENKIFSFPKVKEKNSINKNYQTNIYNKINLMVKLVSPDKTINNNSIELGNISKNININKKKLKANDTINSNSAKKKENIILKKKSNVKKEISLNRKPNNLKKNIALLTDNSTTKSKKDKKNILNRIENIKNKRKISRNVEKLQNSFCDNIKMNEPEQEIRSEAEEEDENNHGLSLKNENINENANINENDLNNDNKDNKENKEIFMLESICKKGFAGPGIKKTNQDNFFIYKNFNNNPNYIYLGICDGHGTFGQGVSTFLVNNLPQNLNSTLLNNNLKILTNQNITTLSPIIISTFLSTNNQLTEDDHIDSAFSGSTCVSLLFTPSRIICINVGDSRCVLGKYDGEKWKAKNLSRDHKPSIISERERIEKSGGKVEAYRDGNGNFVGPKRVWIKGGDIPGLAMSRSFGDEVAHLVGVITDPEIVECFLCKEDKFIVLGSDGLWEFISSEECIDIIKDFYLEKNVEGALTFLYKEASKRWILEEEIIDDITILIAFLN